MAADRWSPESWRTRPVAQVPDYPDLTALADVERQIGGFPPLVFAGEARKLKKALGEGRRLARLVPVAGRRLRREFR